MFCAIHVQSQLYLATYILNFMLHHKNLLYKKITCTHLLVHVYVNVHLHVYLH